MRSSEDLHAPELDALLAEGVEGGVFPGAVAAIGVLGRGFGGASCRRFGSAGRLAPGEAEVSLATIYDLASLTKPLVAATALRLAQRRLIDLHAPVSHYLPELEATQAGESTLALLLSHRAGLAAYARLFAELAAPPGTAEARRFILAEAARRVPERPAEQSGPERSVYSDLGYIVAGEALSRAAALPLDALVQRELVEPLGLQGELFYAARLDEAQRDAVRERVAPTEYCALRGRLLRAEVHDENCYAYGGVAGHAGMFGSARAVLRFGLELLAAGEGRSPWLDQAIVRWAVRPRGDGYVVGWDTKSSAGSSAGETFSARAFGHLGFTGTSIWCDPPRRLCAVLLTNRVHPTRENVAIRAFRPRFHDGLRDLVRAMSQQA
jgi:CubicO group peptidase (beta-lactamase class C family)